jgi:capsular polysaccharide export protein
MGQRRFLFLQGPHGPFFSGLARALMAAGAEVARVGVNAGDAVFWRGLPRYEAFHGRSGDWSAAIEARLDRGVTDLVLYGASRGRHAEARNAAEARGVTVHAFEEGYLRPYWVTYERGGTNASSPLMGLTIADMAAALDGSEAPLVRAPDRWGDMRQHIFWGAAYHAALMVGRRAYPEWEPHRAPGPDGEFRLYLKKLLTMPARRLERRLATRAIRRATFPYHVALLQLAHDANFRDGGPFQSQEEFLNLVMKGFADGAPGHHHLVLKAHPLEDGREPLPPLVRQLAKAHDLENRIHFLTGGKLAALLDNATSAVTVNSTSAEQALWRGLPLKAFGTAVYNRPELVSDQPLPAFFAAPRAPDGAAYETYRRFLLASSQIPGGSYSARGRRRLLRRLPDLLLAAESPYDRLLSTDAPSPQHIRIVP